MTITAMVALMPTTQCAVLLPAICGARCAMQRRTSRSLALRSAVGNGGTTGIFVPNWRQRRLWMMRASRRLPVHVDAQAGKRHRCQTVFAGTRSIADFASAAANNAGRICPQIEGAPIADALVYVPSADRSNASRPDGSYILPLPIGEHEISSRRLASVQHSTITVGQGQTQDFELQSAPSILLVDADAEAAGFLVGLLPHFSLGAGQAELSVRSMVDSVYQYN